MIVELSTARGMVFDRQADGAELRTTDGVITIEPGDENYLNLTETTQIRLRIGTEFITFVLENAAANLGDGRLTVLAESIRRVEPDAISEPVA